MTDNRTAADLRAEARRLLDEADGLDRPISRDELKSMDPHAIVAAFEAGRLQHLLEGRDA